MQQLEHSPGIVQSHLQGLTIYAPIHPDAGAPQAPREFRKVRSAAEGNFLVAQKMMGANLDRGGDDEEMLVAKQWAEQQRQVAEEEKREEEKIFAEAQAYDAHLKGRGTGESV